MVIFQFKLYNTLVNIKKPDYFWFLDFYSNILKINKKNFYHFYRFYLIILRMKVELIY